MCVFFEGHTVVVPQQFDAARAVDLIEQYRVQFLALLPIMMQRIAKLELQFAEAQLSMRRLRSPVRGVVVERILSPGDLAGRNPVLKIAQIDPLRVEVFAPISLLGKRTRNGRS